MFFCILWEQRPVSLLQISLVWCLSAGFLCLFGIWTQLFAFSFSTDNLNLVDCSVTWSQLTWTDADWTCWLTADSQARKHKHKFETDSDNCHTVLRLYTAYKQNDAGCCCWCINQSRTAEGSACSLDSHLITTMCKKCYLWDFKKLPNQNNIHIQIIRCRHERLYQYL